VLVRKRHDFRQQPRQFGWFDGLAEEVIHSGKDARLAVCVMGTCRHGDDLYVLAQWALVIAYGPGSLQAIGPRHMHVHQHEVECLLLYRRKSLCAVWNHYDRAAKLF